MVKWSLATSNLADENQPNFHQQIIDKNRQCERCSRGVVAKSAVGLWRVLTSQTVDEHRDRLTIESNYQKSGGRAAVATGHWLFFKAAFL